MSIRNGHVRWAFDINSWRPSLDELRIATTCVQLEEKARLSKFLFRNDFDSSLIGRLLMRQFIKKTTNIDYNLIKFERDNRGKPFFVQTDTNYNLDFNVSHQGSYSVLAGYISKDNSNEIKTKIGVDTMKIEYCGGKSLTEFFRLMNRNFSTNEWHYINKKDTDHHKLESFMRLWCLKESYVKNIGIGITIDLRKISFTIKTDQLSINNLVNDTMLRVNDELQDNWIFEESLLDNKHSVAVSLYNSNNQFINENERKFEILTFNDLIDGYKPLTSVDDKYCQRILQKEYKK